MLGITTADAIAFGTLVLGFVAVYKGLQWGKAAKEAAPISPVASGIAAGFVDKDLMQRMVAGIERIAETLEEWLRQDTNRHDQEVQHDLKEIKDLLRDSKPRPRQRD